MKRTFVIVSFVVLILVTLASAAFAFYLYQKDQKTTASSDKTAQDRAIERLRNFMDLPADKPSVIVITDRDQLQNQEFFRKAQNGDIIVMYEGIRRIILYRPSIQKVIDVAPLIFTDDQARKQQDTFVPPVLRENPMATKSAVTQKNAPVPVESSESGAIPLLP